MTDCTSIKDASGAPALHSWHGAGWYTMRQWDDERGGFTSHEAPEARWYKGEGDFCDDYGACAGGLDNGEPAYGVEVGFHGHGGFPDDDVDVAPGYGDFDYEVWDAIRTMGERPMAYTTIQDVVDFEIAPALDEPADFDVLAIAHECWHYVPGYGFLPAVGEDGLWQSVMRHCAAEEA